MDGPDVTTTTLIMTAERNPWETTAVAKKAKKTKRRGNTSDDGAEAIAHRLAQLRRDKGITQEEMAEMIGVSQPVVSEYERGTLRLHGELLVALTRILRVSADEILGLQNTKTNGHSKNRRLLRRLQQIDDLPKRDQDALLRTIDAFLSKG